MSEIASVISRRCGHCREIGHNIRSCEKRITEENSGKRKMNEMIIEIENYKQESFRKRQIISSLLISHAHLDRKNAFLNNIIFKLKDDLSKARQVNNDTFAVHSMKELLVKAKECCDICYTDFNYDNIVIKSCWHKCCTTCNEQLDKCHVCRQ